MNTNNTGTTKIASELAASIPPATVQPMVFRASAPAPDEKANGNTPRMKASDVMIIGRRRNCTASSVAATMSIPRSTRSFANSTISMAFFVASPMSVINPICA